MYTTGCEFLDEQLKEKGIPFTDYKNPDHAIICEECPFPECNDVVRERKDTPPDPPLPPPREVTLQCQGCGDQVTVTYRGAIMDRIRKFEQVGDEVYHNCNQTKCIIIKVRSN